MRRTIPLVLGMMAGVLVVVDFFVAHPVIDSIGAALVDWVAILGAFALIVGALGVASVHASRLVRGHRGWPYSFCLLLAMAAVVVNGLMPGSDGPSDSVVVWIFDYVYTPLSASMFALLAFFVVSAAYRSLRLRTREVAVMAIVAVVVLLAQLPLAGAPWGTLPVVRDWLVAYPMTAGVRGIILGVSIGIIATSFRVLIGSDRQYME